MIEFLLALGFLWIILRILAAFITLPFVLLGALLNMPVSVIFWVLLILMIFMSWKKSGGNDWQNGSYRMRKLFRSRTNRYITGICGGIGEYFDVDPTLVRLAFAALAVFGGGTIIVMYLIASLIIPSDRFYD